VSTTLVAHRTTAFWKVLSVPAAGLSTVSARRRSLLTATAAGAVLCGLWFVPTAKATPDGDGPAHHAAGVAAPPHEAAGGAQDAVPGGAAETSTATLHSAGTRPAGVNSSDVGGSGSPYVLAGLGLAGVGGVLVVRSRRRTAAARSSQTSSPVTD
jgi:MYXO-CTERM domain-containing protein